MWGAIGSCASFAMGGASVVVRCDGWGCGAGRRGFGAGCDGLIGCRSTNYVFGEPSRHRFVNIMKVWQGSFRILSRV